MFTFTAQYYSDEIVIKSWAWKKKAGGATWPSNGNDAIAAQCAVEGLFTLQLILERKKTGLVHQLGAPSFTTWRTNEEWRVFPHKPLSPGFQYRWPEYESSLMEKVLAETDATLANPLKVVLWLDQFETDAMPFFQDIRTVFQSYRMAIPPAKKKRFLSEINARKNTVKAVIKKYDSIHAIQL